MIIAVVIASLDVEQRSQINKNKKKVNALFSNQTLWQNFGKGGSVAVRGRENYVHRSILFVRVIKSQLMTNKLIVVQLFTCISLMTPKFPFMCSHQAATGALPAADNSSPNFIVHLFKEIFNNKKSIFT